MRPRMGNSRSERGRMELYVSTYEQRTEQIMERNRVCQNGDSPVVIVERLQLRKIAVERGHRFRPYAPERPNLENFPWCDSSGTSCLERG